jgi:hypothetical protein
MKHLVCGTHGHCFDGLASAALFSEVFERLEGKTNITYLACGYGPGHRTPPTLDGDFNALLDYRYIGSSRLTHYFDHHATAFETPEERASFEAQKLSFPQNFVWDPSAVSCATLIARHAEKTWGLEFDAHKDLLAWAHKIDGARFESAEEASDREAPVMRLTSVVEKFGSKSFLSEAVPLLRSEGLAALAEAPLVKNHYRSLAKKFLEYARRVELRGRMEGEVAFVDLTEKPVEVVAKFAQYEKFPLATYSILVTLMTNSVKISVGYNPWCTSPRRAALGDICAEYGGGGHPYVGAVALPLDEVSKALELASTISRRLNQAGG